MVSSGVLIFAQMNSMDKAKTEYFELLRQLNKSNKTKNEATQLDFIIEVSTNNRSMLYASISKSQKVLLCIQIKKIWRSAGFSGYDDLEKFICKNIVTINEQDVTKLILRNLFKLSE